MPLHTAGIAVMASVLRDGVDNGTKLVMICQLAQSQGQVYDFVLTPFAGKDSTACWSMIQ